MANQPRLTNRGANSAADAVCALANSGLLRIYDGSQPATADTAVIAQVLLAELTLNATAFGAAVNGVATANAITADSSANATGTATWFRVLDSGGVDLVDNLWDGSVDTAGADLNLNSVAISAGASVSVTSFTYTQSKT